MSLQWPIQRQSGKFADFVVLLISENARLLERVANVDGITARCRGGPGSRTVRIGLDRLLAQVGIDGREHRVRDGFAVSQCNQSDTARGCLVAFCRLILKIRLGFQTVFPDWVSSGLIRRRCRRPPWDNSGARNGVSLGRANTPYSHLPTTAKVRSDGREARSRSAACLVGSSRNSPGRVWIQSVV